MESLKRNKKIQEVITFIRESEYKKFKKENKKENDYLTLKEILKLIGKI